MTDTRWHRTWATEFLVAASTRVAELRRRALLSDIDIQVVASIADKPEISDIFNWITKQHQEYCKVTAAKWLFREVYYLLSDTSDEVVAMDTTSHLSRAFIDVGKVKEAVELTKHVDSSIAIEEIVHNLRRNFNLSHDITSTVPTMTSSVRILLDIVQSFESEHPLDLLLFDEMAYTSNASIQHLIDQIHPIVVQCHTRPLHRVNGTSVSRGSIRVRVHRLAEYRDGFSVKVSTTIKRSSMKNIIRSDDVHMRFGGFQRITDNNGNRYIASLPTSWTSGRTWRNDLTETVEICCFPAIDASARELILTAPNGFIRWLFPEKYHITPDLADIELGSLTLVLPLGRK